MDNTIDIFISYARGDDRSDEGRKRQEVLDIIQKIAKEKPFIKKVFIDIRDILFRGSIKNFTQDIGKAKYIIIILSDKYLKSQWCLEEVSMMLEYPDFRDRIFPVVLEDAKIYDPEGRAAYTLYWQKKVKDLENKIKEIDDPVNTLPLIKDLNTYRKINKAVSNFTDTIGLMKVLNAEMHIKSKFEALFKAIETQQNSIQSKINLEKVKEDYDNLFKEFNTLDQKFQALKNESNKSKKEFGKIKLEYENQIEKYKKQVTQITNELENRLNDQKAEIEQLASELDKSKSIIEKLDNELKEINRIKDEAEAVKKKRIREEKITKQKASQPFNILKLKRDATSAEISKQYIKLKNEFNIGIKNTLGNMKQVYENELQNLEDAYEKTYMDVKDKEDEIISKAYTSLNLMPGVHSGKIKQKYNELQRELNNALNSDHKNVVYAAKESIENLEFQYKYLYSSVKKKEDEEVAIIEKIKPKNMVFVKGGGFMMGDRKTSIRNPSHEVELNSYFIDKYPLRVKEYRMFCEKFNIPMPKPPPWGLQDDQPMVNISWAQAREYALLTGKRFPTEAEWEFAARGGILSKNYDYAGSNNIGEIGWYSNNSKETSNPVGLKKPNELGIYDMSGNVWEWCNDWYDENYYKNCPVSNPKGPKSANSKVLRGGSFKVSNNYCKISKRSHNLIHNSNESWGVRFVKEYK